MTGKNHLHPTLLLPLGLLACACDMPFSTSPGGDAGGGGSSPTCTTPAPEPDTGAGGSLPNPPLEGGGPVVIEGDALPRPPGGDPFSIDAAAVVSSHFGEAVSFFAGTPPLNALVIPSGTNGRFCESCHNNERGWILGPADAQSRFRTGAGSVSLGPRSASNESAAENDDMDPIFRRVDGTVSPLADVSTPSARERAYALLLSKALFRVGLPMPGDAEFSLAEVDDPYGYASARELSLFRRPLLMSNLRFTTTLMWDGRDTEPCAPLSVDLASQANNAALGHAEASEPLSDVVRRTIVGAELGIYFAQHEDKVAGRLDEDGARGGPARLAEEPFYVGINAFGKTDPEGVPYRRAAFDLYRAWSSLSGDTETDGARRRIARGEALFNERSFAIAGVRGLNDELGRHVIEGTCTSCHNAPNVGSNSEGWLMDIGASDASRRTPDLPLYTFVHRTSKETIRTTDPGRALVTGRWRDMNRFKVPALRGLAVRAPYLHDGSAPTLAAVVDFHDARFQIGLTPDEKQDLIAFLASL